MPGTRGIGAPARTDARSRTRRHVVRDTFSRRCTCRRDGVRRQQAAESPWASACVSRCRAKVGVRMRMRRS